MNNLMANRYQWSTGAKFSEIMKMTTVFEGSVIRSMRRLEELLRQLTVRSLGETTRIFYQVIIGGS